MAAFAFGVAVTGCEGEKTWRYEGEFHRLVEGADRLVILEYGSACAGDPDERLVLHVVEGAQEVRGVAEKLQFHEEQTREVCMCCGSPGLDWYRGGELVASSSVQHGEALRFGELPGDVKFTADSAAWYATWIASVPDPRLLMRAGETPEAPPRVTFGEPVPEEPPVCAAPAPVPLVDATGLDFALPITVVPGPDTTTDPPLASGYSSAWGEVDIGTGVPDDVTVLRLQWHHSFREPLVVRVEIRGDEGRVLVKRLSSDRCREAERQTGDPALGCTPLPEDLEVVGGRSLRAEEWPRTEELLAAARFPQLSERFVAPQQPRVDDQGRPRIVFENVCVDGSTWTLELWSAGRYQRIIRDCEMEDGVQELLCHVLHLSGLEIGPPY